MWVEQCWRDVLKITFEMENKTEEFNAKYSILAPLQVNFVGAQQFILSRAQMRRRPLSVYKKLLNILNEQEVCHIGEPDYDNLYATKRLGRNVGPEPARIPGHDLAGTMIYGRHVQGGTMEHLAHVIFGHLELEMSFPDREVMCQNFLPKCTRSPCYDIVAGEPKEQAYSCSTRHEEEENRKLERIRQQIIINNLRLNEEQKLMTEHQKQEQQIAKHFENSKQKEAMKGQWQHQQEEKLKMALYHERMQQKIKTTSSRNIKVASKI